MRANKADVFMLVRDISRRERKVLVTISVPGRTDARHSLASKKKIAKKLYTQ